MSTTAFTLTMLGTDTVYTPDLKSKRGAHAKKDDVVIEDYPKGETLSVISSLVKITTAPQPEANYPYQAKEIAVVNGPNTNASNVGEKIALGLAAALKAIAQGQKPINIIAHSRGAVESILIAHELEAIQKMISNCVTIDEVIHHLSEQQNQRWAKGKYVNNTPNIIPTLTSQLQKIPPEEKEAWFNNLKNNISATSINFLGLDPVPGDVFFPITWCDERFFTLPGIIKNAEIIYYENERSDWGFTPIYPDAVAADQNIRYYSMPGHHGTGSAGNNAAQNKTVVAPEGTKNYSCAKIANI